MTYYIQPKLGWETFTQHAPLIDYIYAQFTPLVKQGNWHYLNLSAGLVIFEDPQGNALFLVYDGEDSQDYLVSELKLFLPKDNPVASHTLLSTLRQIEEAFGLSKVHIE